MNTKIKIQEGMLQGKLEHLVDGETFLSFKGIPYAKPPIGHLRFKSPEPPDKWGGIKDATTHSDFSIQFNPSEGKIIGSEDCLYLNVYTPIKASKLPVMVYVHGGAYQFGSGNAESIGPNYLMRKNVVLVVMNYRLGALGFLCLHNEDIPGNAGLKDQVAALKWVKTNIERFGGDESNITLFGESAGSVSVTFHLFSPLSSGLFHKVIAQSGVCTNYRIYGEDTVDIAFKLGKHLGIEAKDKEELFEYLLNVPAKDFLNIPITKLIDTSKTPIDVLKEGFNMTFTPVVERFYDSNKTFLAKTIEELIEKGEYHDVPMIIGCNNGEGIIQLGECLKCAEIINENFSRFVPVTLRGTLKSTQIENIAAYIKNFYFGSEQFTELTKENMVHLCSDALYIHSICSFAKELTKKFKNSIFFYVMSFYGDLNYFSNYSGNGDLGLACHADELFYIFNSISTREETDFGSDSGTMIENITTLWTNFAKNGNPTPNADKWKPVTDTVFNYLSMCKTIELKVNPFKDRMDFWNGVFMKYS